ncbi:MAG: hypothetical protein U0235_02760 [Polyangiaceae bacterium]
MSWTLEALAETGSESSFTTFGPFVPAVDDGGRVLFTAQTGSGRAVFVQGGDEVTPVIETGDHVTELVSHPVAAGDVYAVYAACGDHTALVIARGAGAPAELVAEGAGPLGPTVNAHGDVAFRATDSQSVPSVFKRTAGGDLTLVARADGAPFRAFHGLPVIDDAGRVVFRADHASGPGVFVCEGGRLREVGDASPFAALGFFPSANGAGRVVIAARTPTGASLVLAASLADTRRRWEVAHATADALTGVRGALVDESGGLIVIETRADGGLAISSAERPIVAVGDDVLGSRVRDLALNPVSVRAAGIVAVRLVLEDGREIIARATRR